MQFYWLNEQALGAYYGSDISFAHWAVLHSGVFEYTQLSSTDGSGSQPKFCLEVLIF